MGLLEGKCAIVTGSASGMGRATARLFAKEGARVLGVDISEQAITSGDDGLIHYRADVAEEAEVIRMINHAVDQFGRIDVLCNVVGIGIYARTAEMHSDAFDRVLDVNLRSVFLGMRYAIPRMVAQNGGSIINWSSVGGLNASDRGTVAYAASKAGVNGATKVAAIEYGYANVRVNALCPGFIMTEVLGKDALERFPNGGLLEKAPLMRAGRPDEVAEVAAFLASDRASFVSGAIIPVDGGWSARLA